MKLLILEGCDKTGKSTMVAGILNKLQSAGVKVGAMHWGRPQATTPKDNYLSWISNINQSLECRSEEVIIWDRSFIGNHVYGLLRNEEQRLDFNGVMEFLNYIHNNLVDEIVIVLLQADYGTLCRRFEEDKEDAVNVEDITFLQWKYKILMEYIQAVAPFMPWANMQIWMPPDNVDLEHIHDTILQHYLP